MSETRPYGDGVDDTPHTDADVAARASEGLAEAEAARHDEPAVWTRDGSAPATDTWGSASSDDTARADDADRRTTPETTSDAPSTASSTTAGSRSTADDADDEYVPGQYSTRLYDEGTAPAATTAATTTAAASPSSTAETVAVAPAVADASRQPIFVQAPEAPIARGNRAAAGAIGLLAAVVFAVLYLGVALGLGALTGAVTGDTVVSFLLTALTSWSLWVPVAVFFVAFWLLGAIINRGRWATWVVLGLLVGVAAYGGHIAGALFQAPFWTLTAREGAEVVEGQLLAPLAVAAFVIGRELTIWFGAWVARRGRRMTELNVEAQREYERTLEAGPKLYAS